MRAIASAVLVALAAAHALAATPVPAQARPGKPERREPREPKRPELDATADTNDAWAYYNYGLRQLSRRPHLAADAFRWASRLAPVWAEPYYARRIALLMSDGRRLEGYVARRSHVLESPEVRAIDSLGHEALIRDPFLYHKLDRVLLERLVEHEYGIGAYVDRLRSGNPFYDAWLAYSDAKFAEAARLYGVALARRPEAYELRGARARAFYHLQQYDSAARELTLLLEEMRKRDAKKLTYEYESKGLYEYSLGIVYAQQGRYDEAREALGRALSEDLAFHMAHAALGDVALLQGDTATALAELALAVELRETDAGLRYQYALALLAANRGAEAAAQLQQAVAREPHFALPYYYLARLYDSSGMPDEAIAHFNQFLARAPRAHGDRAFSERRLAELQQERRAALQVQVQQRSPPAPGPPRR